MTNSLALFYINRNKTNDITTLQQTRRLSAYVKQTQIGAPNNLPATWALEWINTRLLTTDTNRSCRYRNPRLGTARRCQSRRQSAQISKSRLKTQKIDDIFCLTMGSNHCLFAHPRIAAQDQRSRSDYSFPVPRRYTALHHSTHAPPPRYGADIADRRADVIASQQHSLQADKNSSQVAAAYFSCSESALL